MRWLLFSLCGVGMMWAAEPFESGVVTPELAKKGGWQLVDLNGDKYDDLVISNADGYGVYLFNPVEKKNVDWKVGWTQVLREGKPGDANSLPSMLKPDGGGIEVSLREGALWVKNEQTQALPGGVKKIPYSELLRVPGPAPLSPEASLKALQASNGWEVRLVAAEPLVQDPSRWGITRLRLAKKPRMARWGRARYRRCSGGGSKS
jgi:hypothetical protein